VALVSPYDFAFPGGVTEHVAHLAEQFMARGHQVHILAPSSDDETEPPMVGGAQMHRIGRVTSVPANGSIARIALLIRYWRTKKLLLEHQFDVIHLHEPLMPALPWTVLHNSASTNVGTFHAYRKKPLTYLYGKPFLRGFFNKLHGHIAVSPSAREFVGEYFSNPDYRIIPNGIDFTRFNTPQPLIERFMDGRPNVLFVGRLEKRKGLRFLMRAWSLVRERCPEARLIVVGSGRPLEGYRRFAAKQGWSDDDVHFAGYVSATELPRYYQMATIFCAPSTGQESFGIVLLEAMAAGAPIVASDIPGYRDVLVPNEDGVLVPPEDREALAAALSGLLLNPGQRQRMVRAGQRKARDYDWPQVAQQVLRYYGETLERRAELEAIPRVRFSRMRRMAGLLALAM
jgi:phosphatidylinositol alpha-mannosyltransferase